jgi:cytochrome c-type biogenesis protein CcmH/NrfG
VAAQKKNCPWCGIANPVEAELCLGCGSRLNPGTEPVSEVRKIEPTAAVKTAPQEKSDARKPKAKGARDANKQTVTIELRYVYLLTAIAAVVIIGYLFVKNDETVAPTVPQNATLIQSDSTNRHIAELEQFLAANPNDKDALLTHANMLHDAKLFPRAIAAYKKYLEIVPKNPDARVDLAICLYESGDTPASLIQLNQVLTHSPKHQPAMFNMGIIYLNQEKVKESNDWFSRCVAVDPTTPIAARAKQLLSQHSLTNTKLQ